MCLAEWLATNVDPCAATSGGNLSMVLAFWATFSLISGWLLRCCLQPFPFNSVAKYALLYCFPSLCLWIASQATFRFFYGIEGLLENLAIWPWIYEVQCYNESEPKTIVVAVVMGIIFYLLMVAGLFGSVGNFVSRTIITGGQSSKVAHFLYGFSAGFGVCGGGGGGAHA